MFKLNKYVTPTSAKKGVLLDSPKTMQLVRLNELQSSSNTKKTVLSIDKFKKSKE